MQFKDIHFHDQLFSAWEKMIHSDSFPHTVLLSGNDGYGPLYLAVKLADGLLCQTPQCSKKIIHFNHPDLHYFFPNINTAKSGPETYSGFYIKEWQDFLHQNLFGNYDDWMQTLEAGNKQGMLRVKDAEEMIRLSFQYPALGKNKVFIIWHAEKMNSGTANKLLKLLEEPPQNTYFILTTDSPLDILPTIRSRCQIYEIPFIKKDEMTAQLSKMQIEPAMQEQIMQVSEGDWNKVLKLLSSEDPFSKHKDYFVRWVRIAYSAKKRPRSINELIQWSNELADEPKFFQFDFLRFALEIFRKAYLSHFNPEIIFPDFKKQQFNPEKFAPFVHSGNIENFHQFINEAYYHLQRNANPKITFLDLSIQLTKLLHKKENQV